MAPNSKARAKAGSEFNGEANERGLDITDIHEQWDACVDVRNRLRAGQSLLHPKSGLSCDNSVCRLNRGILEPVLLGMSGADRKLPSLPDLRHEMSCCYRANNLVGKEVQEQVVGDAVHIRKLLSHVKSTTRRQEVSLETRSIFSERLLYIYIYIYIYIYPFKIYTLIKTLSPNKKQPCIAQDHDFQELCLALDPSLQALCYVMVIKCMI